MNRKYEIWCTDGCQAVLLKVCPDKLQALRDAKHISTLASHPRIVVYESFKEISANENGKTIRGEQS